MSFSALGLLPSLVDSLAKEGIVEPSPVQKVAIPALLGGRSVIAVARTGSGKTAAYGAPVLQRLRVIEDAEGPVTQRARPRAVVLTGTRELVEQTTRALKALAHGAKQRVRGVYGGMNDREVGAQLRDPVDVLVANPARLRALTTAGKIKLDDVRVLVLDEGDTLCAPSERPDVDAVMRAAPAGQLALFSATLPEPIRHWALGLPCAPVLLLAKDAHSTPETVKVHNHKLRPSERADTAHDILVALPRDQRGIVFTNRRESADEAGAVLTERGHSVVVIHGGHLPRERREQLAKFRAGGARVLVTTELGGRGLHIDDLAWVMNWELPEKPSEYLHRVGRVGRQGARGEVHNLVTEADGGMVKEIARLAAGGRLNTGEAQHAARDRVAQTAAQAPRRRAKGTAGKGGAAGGAAGAEGTARRGPKAPRPPRKVKAASASAGGTTGFGGGGEAGGGGFAGKGSGGGKGAGSGKGAGGPAKVPGKVPGGRPERGTQAPRGGRRGAARHESVKGGRGGRGK